MTTTIVSMGIAVSTGVLDPSVFAGMSPRANAHEARPAAPASSLGRVTG